MSKINESKKYNFEDVLILPKKTEVYSRKNVNIFHDSINIQNKKYMENWQPLPIMSSNMDTITDTKFAFELLKRNWITVLHKFVSVVDIIELFDKIDIYNNDTKNILKIDYRNVFVSIGITNKDQTKLETRLEKEKRICSVCIDVANGHSIRVINYSKELKEGLCKDKILMVGNIGNPEIIEDYIQANIDILKIGIGPGCFIENTKIITKNKIKSIQNIKVGDFVLTHKNRFKKVIGTTVYKEKDSLLEVNGEYSTLSHEYYVIDKENKNVVNEDNLEKYAYFIKAYELNKEKHLIVKYEK